MPISTQELLAWIEANKDEGHLHKRLALIKTALGKSGPAELRVFEGPAAGYYSDEKARQLLDAAAKDSPEGIEADAALCMLAAYCSIDSYRRPWQGMHPESSLSAPPWLTVVDTRPPLATLR